MKLPESINNHAVRSCYKAVICLENTVSTLMSMVLDLERHAAETGAECDALDVLASIIAPLNDLESQVAGQFEQLTGKRHPLLDAF